MEKKLGKLGRILVRPSGTEPKIRVTAEAKTGELMNRLYDDAARLISEVVKKN